MASPKYRIPHAVLTLMLFTTIYSTVARAVNNSPQGKIKHVIIVFQENRTPDNLFYLDNTLYGYGADIRPRADQLLCGSGDHNQIPIASYALDACFDPKHEHRDWTMMFAGGQMNGACDENVNITGCDDSNRPPTCPVPGHFQYCPEYSYAKNPKWDGTHTLLQPYFEIAEHYGFANRMFQTNQGPSFPAHLFILSGTSAPVPGTPGQNPTCPGKYCHDFGSILNFIEYTFGTGGNTLGEIGDANYPYADHFAPDGHLACGNACPYSLSDFFGDFDSPHAFTEIHGAKYSEDSFHHPLAGFPGFVPEDPDNDAQETD